MARTAGKKALDVQVKKRICFEGLFIRILMFNREENVIVLYPQRLWDSRPVSRCRRILDQEQQCRLHGDG